MANIQSAKKRARQSEEHRQHNASRRSTLKTFIKKVETAIVNQDKDAANAAYREAVPMIDRSANKRLIHKNKAARYKSQLASRIRAL